MKRLGSIVSYRKGKPPKTSAAGTVPVLTPGYLRTSVIEELAEPTSRDVVLSGNEIILLWDGSNAGEFFRARCGILSSTMVVFDFDEKETDRDYLFYELKRFEPQLKGQTSGSGIPHVDKEILLGRELVERDPKQQGKVVEVLASVDRALEQTEALLAKQQRIKAGLMHDLLTRGLDTQGRLRDPATHSFKPSSLGKIPTEWHVTSLESKRRKDRPYIKTGPFGTTLKTKDWVEAGVPVVTIGALGAGEISRPELLFVTQEKAKELAAYALEEGDLLFSRVADVGRSAVVTAAESGWIMSSNLMRISLDQSEVIPFFAYLNLLTERTAQQTRRSVNASGREVANTAILRSLEFPWPPFDEQREIVKLFLSLDNETHSWHGHLGKLSRLKTGLMQDLLTGRVPVTPLLKGSHA